MIFSYFANVVLSLSLSKLAPPQQNPTDVCFGSTKTLVDVVGCLENFTVCHDYYDQDSYGEAQPTVVQREAWSTAVSTLLRTDRNCSSAIVPSPLQEMYEATTFTDLDGQSFCVLYERTILSYPKFFKKGWGHMIVPSSRDDVARHIHLSAPHPIYDGNVSSEAAQLFKETGAKSLLIPGRMRNAYNVPSTCIRPTTRTSSLMTDPAHNDLEPFFNANIAIWDWQSQQGGCPSASCAFIQLHGKADTTCVEDDIFLSTGLGKHYDVLLGPTTQSDFFYNLGNDSWYTDDIDRPIKRLKRELLAAFNSGSTSAVPVTVSLPSDSNCILTATLNVVGRYLNYFPSPTSHDVCRRSARADATQGIFIHVEQTRRTAPQAAWIRAVNNTFTELNAYRTEERSTRPERVVEK